MATKRMFSLNVVDTDKFLEMPVSARLLYYELGMRADDDGFVDNWKKILLFTGLKEDDMKLLIAKSFIIPFESGVIVIRHWRMNNYLQNDRTKPTLYQDELNQLGLDENNVYTLDTTCIHSIDLDIDKYNKKKSNISKDILPKEKNEKTYFEDVELNNLFLEFLDLRLKLKCKNTDRAIKLLTNELGKYDDTTKIKMLNESIMNSWKSVYPPKEIRQKQGKGKTSAMDEVLMEMSNGTIRFQ